MKNGKETTAPEVEQLQGVPVTLDMIMCWKVGDQLELAMGGREIESNPERLIYGRITSIGLLPSPPGTIGDAQMIEVALDPSDRMGGYHLYTWHRGLRYGGDARQVRLIRREAKK